MATQSNKDETVSLNISVVFDGGPCDGVRTTENFFCNRLRLYETKDKKRIIHKYWRDVTTRVFIYMGWEYEENSDDT